jgi:hypothetical protein
MLRRMLRAFPLCLLVCLSSLGLAQQSGASNIQSPAIQVVYVIGSSTITTYNVDPQTLYATQVGNPLTVNATNLDYYTTSVTASPDDRVLYVIGSQSSTSPQYLWVFATDTSGVPQTPSLQANHTTGLDQVLIDPKANFLYAVSQSSDGTLPYTLFTIRSYEVDAQGKLSSPQRQAVYKLDNDFGSEFCTVSIVAFNAAGSELYDQVGCSFPGGESITYNQRTVNLQTGALGPDVEVFSWNNVYGGYESVQFLGNYVFDFDMPNDYQPGANSVNIYPLTANTSTPLLQCTASMLESCGYAATGVAHPSGKYVFMSDGQYFTEIDRVEMTAGKIVDTGNYIPFDFDEIGRFSPDGTIVYAIGPGPFTSETNVEIYGFNVNTSEVTPGGAITLSGYEEFVATQRE